MLLQDKEILDKIEFKEGQSIFLENNPSKNAYVIVKGAVSLSYANAETGSEVIIRRTRKGELIGELDWLNNQSHIFTVKAVEDVHCLAIPNKNLVKNYLKSPPSVQGIMRNCVNTLRGVKNMEGYITASDVLSTIQALSKSFTDDDEA